MLLWVLLLFAALAYTEDGIFFLRDNSLVAPFAGNWNSYGSAVLTTTHVSLTTNVKGANGGVFNIYPLYSRDWEVRLSFKVHGSTGSMFGDGFAFWYTQDRIKPGHALGAAERFRGLGIFFDTYNNHNGEHSHQHPYISAMVSNGSTVYDHDKDGTHTQLAGCHSSFRNHENGAQAKIRYEKEKLTVYVDVGAANKWSECFSVDGVRLPTGYFLGLSAATGDLTDNHDIIFLKTYDIHVQYTDEQLLEDRTLVEPFAATAEAEREHAEDTHRPSRWGKFAQVIWWLFIATLLVGVCCMAYYLYQGRQSRRKRLY
nr:unnamed protein product [Spirometra erinaceieuropaei]